MQSQARSLSPKPLLSQAVGLLQRKVWFTPEQVSLVDPLMHLPLQPAIDYREGGLD
ncbi:MAG: hypothetical protein MI924_37665 [Chloroflexales bacterium]|nr:hypothetical protein [Chloroflexales bacterium]